MEQLALERERLQQDILLHAQELAAEMNLRLLLDRELGLGGEENMFYVESVTVTNIIYPVERRQGFFAWIKSKFKDTLTYFGGLLHPKSRRKGRHAFTKCRNKLNRTLRAGIKGHPVPKEQGWGTCP